MILGLLVVAASLAVVLATILHGGKKDPDPRPPHLRPRSKK